MVKEVMLIDDNPIDLILNEKVIEDARFCEAIISQPSAMEALTFLKERISNGRPLPKLILLDLMMPEMDGISFLKELNKLQGDKIGGLNIVMVSSTLGTLEIQEIKGNPYVIDYLSKPLTTEKLKRLSYKLKED